MWTFVSSYIGALRRFRRLRGETLRRWQDARERTVVTYAKAHSPFYREHDGVIDKAVMMANFDAFNTRGIRLDDAMAVALRAERDRDFAPTIAGLTVGLSSGTSGHRGLFLVDRKEQLRWAGTILARALPRLRRGLRLAFFLRSNSNLYQTLGRWIDFRYFDLMLPIDEAVAQLNAFQPHLVAGPPSLLAALASARELNIHPERLISVAEVLEPQDEERLRRRFGVDVHQVYQCTEGLLAVSCARGSLHVQEDIVKLDFEPANDGRVIPIVTDLWRRVQPIVRYRLNDILTLSPDPCPCGSAFQVIKSIEGRCDDVCVMECGDKVAAFKPFYPDTLRRILLLADARIDDYQLVQERPGQLRVRLQVRGDFDDVAANVRVAMAEGVAQYGCRPPLLAIEQGIVAPAPGEKRRRVRCLSMMRPT